MKFAPRRIMKPEGRILMFKQMAIIKMGGLVGLAEICCHEGFTCQIWQDM